MDEPIRIAQVMGKMNGGGVEAVVMNYYRNIDKNRIQFDFIVDSDSRQVPRAEIEAMGGRVFEVPAYSHLLSYKKALRQLFETEKWTIVHSHINALSVFPLGVAKKKGVPVRIAHSHNTSGKGEHLRNIIKNVLKLFANKNPTHRFACGELAGKWLFGKNTPFELVYNAIDLDAYAFDAETRSKMRESLGLPDDLFVVGHVGRFMSQKNHAFLLEAFSRFCKEHDKCILVCAGEGELFDETKAKAESLGIADKIKFLGQRSDVAELYQAFDVFVLPSLYEGLCVVGVEAQRSGLPCLMSDQITREISITDLVCYLPIEDPEVWSAQLEKVASNSENTRIVDDSCFYDYNITTAAQKLGTRYLELYASAQEDAQ